MDCTFQTEHGKLNCRVGVIICDESMETADFGGHGRLFGAAFPFSNRK